MPKLKIIPKDTFPSSMFVQFINLCLIISQKQGNGPNIRKDKANAYALLATIYDLVFLALTSRAHITFP